MCWRGQRLLTRRTLLGSYDQKIPGGKEGDGRQQDTGVGSGFLRGPHYAYPAGELYSPRSKVGEACVCSHLSVHGRLCGAQLNRKPSMSAGSRELEGSQAGEAQGILLTSPTPGWAVEEAST